MMRTYLLISCVDDDDDDDDAEALDIFLNAAQQQFSQLLNTMTLGQLVQPAVLFEM